MSDNNYSLMLHQGQAEVFVHPARFKAVTAGRRWGKSQLGKAVCISKAQRPRSKIWYVAPSYRMAKQIMWDELLDAIPRRWIKKVHNTDLSVKLINGSMIECKGADDPDSLRGVGLYYVVMDEFQDMKPDTWSKVLRPTLARDKGHAMFIGTPKGFANLYDVHVLGQDPTKPQWQSWQFPTITSPFIPLEEIEAAKNDMDAKSFRQEFLASFESVSGRVYHAFDRNIHIREVEFNPTLPIWIGQDFNVDPMSTVIMQPQHNGEVWVVDEIFLRSSNTMEVCDEIEKKYWRYMYENTGRNQITIYPDPAGASRQSGRGESDLDIFRERGFKAIKYRKKHPKVVDRTNAVNRMLMSASGQSRLFIHPRCKNLIESFDQTIYKEGSSDIDKRPSIEHATDALGYGIELEFPTRRVKVLGRSL